jgi:hypothetical protein
MGETKYIEKILVTVSVSNVSHILLTPATYEYMYTRWKTTATSKNLYRPNCAIVEGMLRKGVNAPLRRDVEWVSFK